MNFGYHYSKFHSATAGGQSRDTQDSSRKMDDASNGVRLFDSVKYWANRFEEAGFEFLSFTDHMWQVPVLGQRDDEVLDAFTALAATAAVTDQIKLCPMVTAVDYRHPAVVGRMMASLEAISNGRTVFGIGAGWYEEEYDAYGFDFDEPAVRISRVEDAVKLLKCLWTESQPVTYHGEHYEVEDVYMAPQSHQDPHPPIMVGGGGEQLTLRVVAKHADWWNTPWLTHEEYARKLDVLRDHCKTVGRPFGDIRTSAVDMVVVRDSEEEAHEAYEELMSDAEWEPPSRDEYRGAVGTPEQVTQHVEGFADAGADLYIFEAPRNDAQTLDRFVSEVVPQF